MDDINKTCIKLFLVFMNFNNGFSIKRGHVNTKVNIVINKKYITEDSNIVVSP